MFEVMEQDTHPRMQARYIQLLRAQSPEDRLRKAGELTQAVRYLAERLYGRAVALRLFGQHPALT